jgi:ketosteroid isomerase-like protein
MGQRDNLATMQVLAERWNAGDVEGVIELYDEEIVIRTSPSWPEQMTLHGKERFRAFVQDWREMWDSTELETHEIAANEDKVAVRGAWRSRGRLSGAEGMLPFSMVMTLRDGRVVRLEWFDDHDDALRAAGMKS